MFPPTHRIYCECQREDCPHCNGSTLDLEFNIIFNKNKTMKLAKALKEKKRLAAEIAHLKNLINKKNSYIKGSNTPEKFIINDMNSELLQKIQRLVNLKIAINEANKEIQPSIYLLGEYKALVSFYGVLDTKEGIQESYSDNILEYAVQLDEVEKEKLVKEYQEKADLLQDQIDTYNYTTDVAWDEEPPAEKTEEKSE